MADYLLSEDGFHLLLEDGSGAILLESSPAAPESAPTRVTQLALQFLQQGSGHARLSQIALEVFYPLGIPTRVTHAPLELFDVRAAAARMTQEVVELFTVVPPCTSGDFPVDDVGAGGSCGTPQPGPPLFED